MAWRRRTRLPNGRDPLAPPAWSQERVLGLMAMLLVVTGLLVWGLIVWASSLGHSHPPADHQRSGTRPATQVSAPANAFQGQTARDKLAARPMPTDDSYDSYLPSPLSTRNPGAVIVLPHNRDLDQLGVPTGYPHTPIGALAQLIAIDQAALQPGSLPRARAVISAWAAPGGPTPSSWSGVSTLAGLLQSLDLPGNGSPRLRFTLSPAMGLIKGGVGPDFSVVCVDFSATVTLDATSSVALADCQRMVWTGRVWLIGPGPEPAAAASVWPDTDAAIDAGWKDVIS